MSEQPEPELEEYTPLPFEDGPENDQEDTDDAA